MCLFVLEISNGVLRRRFLMVVVHHCRCCGTCSFLLLLLLLKLLLRCYCHVAADDSSIETIAHRMRMRLATWRPEAKAAVGRYSVEIRGATNDGSLNDVPYVCMKVYNRTVASD